VKFQPILARTVRERISEPADFFDEGHFLKFSTMKVCG